MRFQWVRWDNDPTAYAIIMVYILASPLLSLLFILFKLLAVTSTFLDVAIYPTPFSRQFARQQTPTHFPLQLLYCRVVR